jgi:hypothetical protein
MLVFGISSVSISVYPWLKFQFPCLARKVDIPPPCP